MANAMVLTVSVPKLRNVRRAAVFRACRGCDVPIDQC